MMNDPAVLEASRAMAQKLLAGYKTDADRIDAAFVRIVCRKPAAKERKVLQQYLEEQRNLFAQGKLHAGKTLNIGNYPMPAKKEETETAALMKTVSAIYNLEEAITK
jgi:hypothetical protein